jgi:AcrR family transcriptional regulator
MELYGERGYEQTTVAEIAKRAGLTERTFFRHFADKREVLFFGAGDLRDLLLRRVGEAPEGTAPLPAVVGALVGAATDIFEERRAFSRRRQAIIAANTELQERELVKMAWLAAALAEALRDRAVPAAAAGLAAEAGVAIFRVAFERWVGDAGERTLATVIEETAAELGQLCGP